jgi:hypothetical protein
MATHQYQMVTSAFTASRTAAWHLAEDSVRLCDDSTVPTLELSRAMKQALPVHAKIAVP